MIYLGAQERRGLLGCLAATDGGAPAGGVLARTNGVDRGRRSSSWRRGGRRLGQDTGAKFSWLGGFGVDSELSGLGDLGGLGNGRGLSRPR